MSGIGYILVIAIPGMFAAAFWALAVGLGGSVGALLGRAGARTGVWPLSVLGFLLSLIGQTYVALAFTTLLVHATSHHLAGIQGPWKWFGWLVAFLVGTSPPLIALLDWARQPARRLQHLAIRVTWPLTMIGFWAFTHRSALMRLGWGWVPVL